MGLDIRTPIGLMFTVLGFILTGAGLFTSGEIYRRSLGINVNLGWGIVLLLFGAVMLAYGLRSGRERREAKHVSR
jgi:hypothetical protein